MSDRLAIVGALEALGAGDTAYAVELLLGALETGSAARPYVCACGAAFEWPGQLADHRRFTHSPVADATRDLKAAA